MCVFARRSAWRRTDVCVRREICVFSQAAAMCVYTESFLKRTLLILFATAWSKILTLAGAGGKLSPPQDATERDVLIPSWLRRCAL